MFYSIRSNSLVNYVSERALSVVYDDHSSSYSELITAKNEPIIHQENIKILMKEMFKFENDLSPPLIDAMFQVRKNNFNLGHF